MNINQSNLVDAMYEKGAHYVLGTTESIYVDIASDWIEMFVRLSSLGYSIEEINQQIQMELCPMKVSITKKIDEKEVDSYKFVDNLPIYDAGDKKQCLKH